MRWRSSRRRKAERIVAAHWWSVCDGTTFLHRYPDPRRLALRNLTTEFLSAKRFESAAGATLDDELELLIATQACVPILELGLGWYDDWVSIIVYPGDFIASREITDQAGVVHHEERALSGEAWDRGPVLLSLEGVLQGARGGGSCNLVIHELVHKLDLRNGAANGMPPLHRDMNRSRWTTVFSGAFEDFRRRAARGEPSLIDSYAAHDPAEFFAVTSEAFFMRPTVLAEQYPDVYAELRAFYRQDPAADRIAPGDSAQAAPQSD